jgi:N-acetylneuraminic acid mutarotase
MKIFLQTLFFFLLVTQMSFAQGFWTKVGDMPENRYAHTVNELNGKIYVVGGVNTETSTYPRTALVYDRSSGVWAEIPLCNNKIRCFHTSCVIDGKLYVIGGGDSSMIISTMDMFDPTTGEWVTKNAMSTNRGLFACASIEDKIYVMGGMNTIDDLTGLSTVEVYDTTNDTWTPLADMPTKRLGHSAVALNGKIYVFGGHTNLLLYRSVDIYDPQTNTWTTKSIMPTERYCLTTCLLDNNIFAIGGWKHSASGPIYDQVEVYNPQTDEWKTERPLPVTRAVLASLVLDGKIYVYGGASTTHPNMGTSAIYELSYDDIFATQPYVDKPYARINIDSVLFRTRFSNIHNHTFTPRLIHANSDSTHLDSLTLYDDGLHGDSLMNDGLYGGFIPPRPIEEFFTLGVSTIDNQTNKYYNTPDRCRFATAGPLVVDSLLFVHNPAFKRFSFKPYLTNYGNSLSIPGVTVKINCNDSGIINFSGGGTIAYPIIPAGVTVISNSICSISYDSTFQLDPLHLKFEIMSNNWPYWKDSIQVIITPVRVEDEINKIPAEFMLSQNYPNPFNSISVIEYSIPRLSPVTLKIFNTIGQEIETLVSKENPAGTYELNWNAVNVPSGVYFYQLKAGEFLQTKKMIFLK